MPDSYRLYYWPQIQGRGEFVRLALEAGGADYIDVARRSGKRGGGSAAIMKVLEGGDPHAPFAPPFLELDGELISQTANILAFLGPRLGLVPADERSRRRVQQLQLLVADFVAEAHDTHHPLATSLRYEEQKPAARKNAKAFTTLRMTKYLGYFERVLARNPDGAQWLVGDSLSYVDLSLFQVVAGLRFAFPSAMKKLEPAYPHVVALAARVAALPRIARYLKSKRRIAFNQSGIFRHYAELDR
ncbi:MAG: glutathione S-transferase [Proteobacteria bacterium]|nr:glutathione S-transferase [Burkholderiales bacterium]